MTTEKSLFMQFNLILDALNVLESISNIIW